MLLILGTRNSPVPVLVLVPVLYNTRTLMRFKSCNSVFVIQEVQRAMEFFECTSPTYRSDTSQ
jgi:hypothetical protein